MDEFSTLSGEGEAELRVKASRFDAVAFGIESDELFRDRLNAHAREFFDATHHCAAYRLRDSSWRTIDGGEPGGSAGAPILAAIDGSGLVDVGVIVTRYFGGTKLGVGGLVRAYGEAAQAALFAAPRRTGIRGMRVLILHPYEATSVVMRCLDRFELFNVRHGFADDGALAERYCTIRAADLPDLTALLREESSGTLAVTLLGPEVVYR